MTPHVSTTLLRTQSDKRLADLTAAGHDRAFEAIVERYRRPLLRYARGFLSESRAEEVVQAALVSAWAALRDDAQVRDLRPWLYRIVHNGAVNAMKRPGGDDAPLSDTLPGSLGPEVEVERREDVRRTLDGIAALPDRQRAALVAVAVDGRAHADVGRELGLTDSGVRQLVRRARVSLRTAATVLTPYPAAQWIAEIGNGPQDTMTTRIAEAVAGAGTAGLAGGAVIKTGAVVATVGAIAAGAPQVDKVVHPSHHRGHSASQHHNGTGAAGSLAPSSSAQPASGTTRTVAQGGGSPGFGSTGDHGSGRSGSGGQTFSAGGTTTSTRSTEDGGTNGSRPSGEDNGGQRRHRSTHGTTTPRSDSQSDSGSDSQDGTNVSETTSGSTEVTRHRRSQDTSQSDTRGSDTTESHGDTSGSQPDSSPTEDTKDSSSSDPASLQTKAQQDAADQPELLSGH